MKRILHMALLGATALGFNAPTFCHSHEDKTVTVKPDKNKQPAVAYLTSEENSIAEYIKELTDKKPEEQRTRQRLSQGKDENRKKVVTDNKETLWLYDETQTNSHNSGITLATNKENDTQNKSVTLNENTTAELNPQIADKFNKNNVEYLFVQRKNMQKPKNIAAWDKDKKTSLTQVLVAVNDSACEPQKPRQSSWKWMSGVTIYGLAQATNYLIGNPFGRLASQLLPGFAKLTNALGWKKHIVGAIASGVISHVASTLKTVSDETGPNSERDE